MTNAFGVYNMAGNVSEWPLDAYRPSAVVFVNDLNPALLYDADAKDGDALKRKVVRGGSWKDNGEQLNSETRNYSVDYYRIRTSVSVVSCRPLKCLLYKAKRVSINLLF